ncbi:MAG: aminomethyl-transferring glycine dehydrogenase subunit GcvPB [Spirochaetaceae bacterium]|nr:aminomethyl-transferring glycine dehydrogenase subunit GcvPB [Spirochaetaceae bacterium]
MNTTQEPLIFELSGEGRVGCALPKSDVPHYQLPAGLERDALDLPQVDELTVVRHYSRLSQKNYSIDTNFYPLGSCTMKYNPKVNETAAGLPGWRLSHPLAGEKYSQGSLELIYKLQASLAEIGGFKAVSLQPAAGAHGEFSGVLMIRKYLLDRGEAKRTKMLIPDSAHGTNPASCAMAGFETQTIPSGPDGNIDMKALKAALDDRVAGIMITNPNTLGLFEKKIEKIAAMVHKAGGLVYGDGANMNALVGVFKPGEAGIDVMHFNLHKTFSTPHGGGGPGAGMIAAGKTLAPYLPGPVAVKNRGQYGLQMPDRSIGRVKSFLGNFGVLVRAYAYILMQGKDGLRRIAENSVLNANYLKASLEHAYVVKYPHTCMHEFVAMGDVAPGIHTLDIAKRLIDYGFHPPTIYFPLIVPEALMIEPTETESKETLDAFVEAMLAIAREAVEQPQLLHDAPVTTPVGRLDEVQAARYPVLRYKA